MEKLNSFFSEPYEKFKNKPLKQESPVSFNFVTKDLKKTIPFLKNKWRMQDNFNDELTDKIVYSAESFDELLELYNMNKHVDLNYLVHRWYNKRTSDMSERIFCSYNIAKKERDFKHKYIDFYLMDTPFDLKVTSYPQKFGKHRGHFDNDRSYRNELIKWLYNNQSKGRRNHLENRLFIVCKHKSGQNSKNNLLLKMDFNQIHSKVHSYLTYSEKLLHKIGKPFNEITLQGGEKVLSDIIFIQ